MEFQVVWTAEDFAGRTAVNRVDQRRALPETGSKSPARKNGYIDRIARDSGVLL